MRSSRFGDDSGAPPGASPGLQLLTFQLPPLPRARREMKRSEFPRAAGTLPAQDLISTVHPTVAALSTCGGATPASLFAAVPASLLST